jgi:hypothetical protein
MRRPAHRLGAPVRHGVYLVVVGAVVALFLALEDDAQRGATPTTPARLRRRWPTTTRSGGEPEGWN